MSLHDQVQQLIQEKIDRLATNDCVEELCIATALAIAVGDLETVNYIGDKWGHLFNEQQQQAFQDIKAKTPADIVYPMLEKPLTNTVVDPEINSMILEDNPLTAHLAQLNRTVQ